MFWFNSDFNVCTSKYHLIGIDKQFCIGEQIWRYKCVYKTQCYYKSYRFLSEYFCRDLHLKTHNLDREEISNLCLKNPISINLNSIVFKLKIKCATNGLDITYAAIATKSIKRNIHWSWTKRKKKDVYVRSASVTILQRQLACISFDSDKVLIF